MQLVVQTLPMLDTTSADEQTPVDRTTPPANSKIEPANSKIKPKSLYIPYFQFVDHKSKCRGPFYMIVGHILALRFLTRFLILNPSGNKRESNLYTKFKQSLCIYTYVYIQTYIPLKGLHNPYLRDYMAKSQPPPPSRAPKQMSV